jgi:hypothetical protein
MGSAINRYQELVTSSTISEVLNFVVGPSRNADMVLNHRKIMKLGRDGRFKKKSPFRNAVMV